MGTIDKAVALSFGLIANHPFHDGNKRIGFSALTVTLALNDFRLESTTDEFEAMVLAVADHSMSRRQMLDWVASRVRTVEV